MGNINVIWKIQELTGLLTAMQRDSVTAVSRALTEEAQLVIRDSNQLAPWLSRTLIQSATIMPPETRGPVVNVRLGYGGAASAYALIQHEKFPKKKKPGRMWHFLALPMMRHALPLQSRVSAALHEVISQHSH